MCVTCAFINPFGGDWLHDKDHGRTLTETGDVPGDTSTNVQLSAGDTFHGTIGFPGDWDWFYVEFEAGVTYTITLTPGTLDDPVIFLADANGAIEGLIDNGFSGDAETFTFTPNVTGSGYLIVDSYYNTLPLWDPAWGVDIGTYTLTITDGAAPPSGDGTPLDAITWNYTAPSVINVYFVPGGMAFDDSYIPPQFTSTWSNYEIQQAQLAFDMFEAVANVTFNIVANPVQADFFMVESTDPASSLAYWFIGGGTVTLNGISYTDLDGWGVFYNQGEGWTTAGLAQGGFGFATILHEIGHGLGLAHPHDTGGGSTVMNGVGSPFNDLGDFDLNQGIYTTMTYNEGWQTAPHGVTPSLGYGYQGTPMALDIAVLQATYGANMATNAGNDSYVLPSVNAAGTFYTAIWDAGGTDTILHNGSAAAVIDLRAATLTYAPGGGGFVSYVVGIHGGFTIAAGVVIENATGGSGNDTITGNDADNLLFGNGGADRIDGGDG
ncbi:M10 family metallopeptidase, partial [uncultured Roseicyclus sp.]|uniref:M10 family metallopeptidase n=1 Tax=uncultured Roseicyclus sp. TaxID=543072 RepID=UPI00261EEE3E